MVQLVVRIGHTLEAVLEMVGWRGRDETAVKPTVIGVPARKEIVRQCRIICSAPHVLSERMIYVPGSGNSGPEGQSAPCRSDVSLS